MPVMCTALHIYLGLLYANLLCVFHHRCTPPLYLQASYVEEGKSTTDASSWAYYHLKKCLHPYIDARECIVEKRLVVMRQMKDKCTPEQWEQLMKNMRARAHKRIGMDKWDEIWSPDLDYTSYFKAYREHMEEAFKLEQEFLEETKDGYGPKDPSKYLPKKFYGKTQVYFDEN